MGAPSTRRPGRPPYATVFERVRSLSILSQYRVHQNVSHHISFLIFYGSLKGCIILLPQEVVLWLVTKILFPAEVVLCSQNTREYEKCYPADEPHNKRTDRRTDGPTDRPTDRRPTDRPTYRPTDRPIDRPNERTNERTNGRPTDPRTDGRTDRRYSAA